MQNTSRSPQEIQKELIVALVKALEASGNPVQQFETHISHVLVAGEFAFKLKKALRLDFLDYSSLEARRFYCEEELRLNRRLTPRLYIDVVKVTGDAAQPRFGSDGIALDYAVRMHRFEQSAVWSNRLSANGISEREIEQLAILLARLHVDAPRIPATMDAIAAIKAVQIMDETLKAIEQLAEMDEVLRHGMKTVRDWDKSRRGSFLAIAIQRNDAGRVRECHGDLHAGNILSMAWGVEVFDCIEFDASLRYIDVMNDIAFILMDLQFYGQAGLSSRCLNRYLECTGDYDGLRILRDYQVIRALIRSKVALLRAGQGGVVETRRASTKQGLAYLALAACTAHPMRCAIMLTHGYSGSGKTSFARLAAEMVGIAGAIHLRSDVERKRLHGLPPVAHTDIESTLTLYSTSSTENTYRRLAGLARTVAVAGWPVIVDAAFLKRWQRDMFAELAAELRVPFFIFDIHASAATMRTRIATRLDARSDASDATIDVLERQLNIAEPLSSEEQANRIAVNMECILDRARVASLCAPVTRLIGVPTGTSELNE